MESKQLNLLDALHLASVLNPYIDLFEDKKASTSDFVGKMVNTMSPMDYYECVKILSTKKITGNEGGDEFLHLLHGGLEKNKVISLVEYYRTSGFS